MADLNFLARLIDPRGRWGPKEWEEFDRSIGLAAAPGAALPPGGPPAAAPAMAPTAGSQAQAPPLTPVDPLMQWSSTSPARTPSPFDLGQGGQRLATEGSEYEPTVQPPERRVVKPPGGWKAAMGIGLSALSGMSRDPHAPARTADAFFYGPQRRADVEYQQELEDYYGGLKVERESAEEGRRAAQAGREAELHPYRIESEEALTEQRRRPGAVGTQVVQTEQGPRVMQWNPESQRYDIPVGQPYEKPRQEAPGTDVPYPPDVEAQRRRLQRPREEPAYERTGQERQLIEQAADDYLQEVGGDPDRAIGKLNKEVSEPNASPDLIRNAARIRQNIRERIRPGQRKSDEELFLEELEGGPAKP